MNFSNFLDFLMGLFGVTLALGFFGYIAAKAILSLPKKTASKSEFVKYISKILIGLYIIYAVTLGHLSFHHSHEYDLSENSILAIYLSIIPIAFGIIFMVPYNFILIQVYLFYARTKYPKLKENKDFPEGAYPYNILLTGFEFLFNRGYKIEGAGKIFTFVSELYRTLVICIFIALMSFSLLMLVEVLASVYYNRKF